MSITFESNFTMNWTKLFVCSVTEGYCSSPRPADPLEGQNDTYGNATPIIPLQGHVLGYRFLVEGTDGTLYKYPLENTSEPGLELVALLDSIYFMVQVQGNLSVDPGTTGGGTDSLAYPSMSGVTLVVLAMAWVMARSKKDDR